MHQEESVCITWLRCVSVCIRSVKRAQLASKGTHELSHQQRTTCLAKETHELSSGRLLSVVNMPAFIANMLAYAARKTHELSSGTLVILPGMHKRQFRALFAQQKRPTNSLSRSRRFRVQAYARKSIYSRGKRNLVSPKRDLLTSNSPKRDLLTSNT
jgi:hypothetical protein